MWWTTRRANVMNSCIEPYLLEAVHLSDVALDALRLQLHNGLDARPSARYRIAGSFQIVERFGHLLHPEYGHIRPFEHLGHSLHDLKRCDVIFFLLWPFTSIDRWPYECGRHAR